ncbi:MAG: TetR/AcrR family transcriptional regulator [Acidobacteria bacterium]|nr:MAG: TetR/AcrR family transcriptional regulator [Acidobacteriota bacterium]
METEARTMSVAGNSSPRDPDKIAEIFRAAARIFNTKGFHATSINEIADAVHLTKAGLYYYIQGKQDLLYRIMDYAMDALEGEVIQPAESIADPEERLRAIVAGHANLITQAGVHELTILVNELEGLSPEQRRQITERQAHYVDLVRETIDTLKARGRVHDVDSTVGAFGLLGMILWVPRWFDAKGRLSSQEVADQLTELALRGLLREPA